MKFTREYLVAAICMVVLGSAAPIIEGKRILVCKLRCRRVVDYSPVREPEPTMATNPGVKVPEVGEVFRGSD